MQTFTYDAGAELPGLTLPWQEETSQDVWTDLDLSAGYTFTLTLTALDGTVALTKTSLIAGAVGSVTVTWAVGDLEQSPGSYRLRLRAREVATSKDRDYSPGSPIYIVIN